MEKLTKDLGLEFDYLSNLNLHRIGPAHGTHKKKFEADAFISRIDHCETDTDLKRQKNKQESESLKAMKIINKLN